MSTARAAATVTMAMTNVPIVGGRRCVLHTAQRSEWFIVGHLAECNKVEGGMWNVECERWNVNGLLNLILVCAAGRLETQPSW